MMIGPSIFINPINIPGVLIIPQEHFAVFTEPYLNTLDSEIVIEQDSELCLV